MSEFSLYLSTLKQKGNLAFEYRPFHNYQTDVDLYEISTNVGKVLVPYGKAVNINTGDILTKRNDKWIDKYGNVINNSIVKDTINVQPYAKAGSLIDLDTDQLNFDLEHPAL